MTGDINPNAQAPSMKVSICDANDPSNILIPSFNNALAITKSDSTVLTPPRQAIWSGAGGDIAVRMFGNQQVVTYLAVPAGFWLYVRVDKVMSTNTSATGVVGVW